MSVKCKRRLINIRGNCLTPGAGIFFYPICKGGRPEVKNECVTQHLSYLVSISDPFCLNRPRSPHKIRHSWQRAPQSHIQFAGTTLVFCSSVLFLVGGGGDLTMLMLVVYLLDNMCIILHMCYPTLENLSKDGKVEFAQFWNKLNLLNKISEIVRNANIH